MKVRVLPGCLPSPTPVSWDKAAAPSQDSCEKLPLQPSRTDGRRAEEGGQGGRISLVTRDKPPHPRHSNSLHVGSQPAPSWSSSLAQPRRISLTQIESWWTSSAASSLQGLRGTEAHRHRKLTKGATPLVKSWPESWLFNLLLTEC